MVQWYMTVKVAEDQTVDAMFYRSDVNPIENHSDYFDHTFIDFPNGKTVFDYADRSNIPDEAIEKDDIRYAVPELDTSVEYWIVDAYDTLGEYFPAAPDVVGHPHPTDFVAVPRNAVVNVYSR